VTHKQEKSFGCKLVLRPKSRRPLEMNRPGRRRNLLVANQQLRVAQANEVLWKMCLLFLEVRLDHLC
jgi:hypothetical protein